MSAEFGDYLIIKVFNRFDKPGKGYLTRDEFFQFIQTLSSLFDKKINISNKIFSDALFDYLNNNGKDKLPYKDFKKWWSLRNEERYYFFIPDKKKKIIKAHRLYRYYTKHKDMDYHEFMNMVAEMNLNYSDYDFDILDRDRDGLLSFKEFCDWLKY